MATIIRTDGSEEKLIGDNPNGSLSLKQMQDVVGGLIQPLYDYDGKTILVANEEGLLEGLALNIRATFIASQKFGQEYGIVGDVIIPDRDTGEEWF